MTGASWSAAVMRRLPVLLALVLAAPAAAQAQWRGVGMTRIPTAYYQGMASDPDGRLFFDGVFVGLHRTDGELRERASVDNVIPPAVTTREGYNHVGDITWDEREGGRVLLPLECFYPGTQPDANTCHTGAIGVADPRTLRWRYYVRLSPLEIPKAMWAEASPDGRLLWTSAGADLLAYRVADIGRGRGPLRAVRRLRGAVPPTGITGAAFYGDRLLLAGQQDVDFEVWSVDLATGARRLEIRRGVVGESEGLDVTDALGGLLHWIVAHVRDRRQRAAALPARRTACGSAPDRPARDRPGRAARHAAMQRDRARAPGRGRRRAGRGPLGAHVCVRARPASRDSRPVGAPRGRGQPRRPAQRPVDGPRHVLSRAARGGGAQTKVTQKEPLEEPSFRSAEAVRLSGRRASHLMASLSAAATSASNGKLSRRVGRQQAPRRCHSRTLRKRS